MTVAASPNAVLVRALTAVATSHRFAHAQEAQIRLMTAYTPELFDSRAASQSQQRPLPPFRLAQRRGQYAPASSDDKGAVASYEGYCKGCVWPFLHYRALVNNGEKEDGARTWPAFYAANFAFADRLTEVYRSGDLIYIDNCHLMFLPR
ncbi:glycosyltransferase family 20 protein [Mixia osmundae IAM 14324]|uniref:Uncharacterized protein n=1 Tax=Mixia osmundae (strain CBS 9802 / IAM 14324 / JCM 22182 / KY 12970) TaxID=764103 RepID=G7DTL8_MIXOS|nr:glycosyltransferase family 20 protein [Mixia osmundae IAM 14324]KEI42798.1 glycosyltransferase family 20 protein [Mixia osmundae IAM 14324]GAA93865.1 hypothetical protein E5Q_00511 [Mixia osmundae IAM 14324]